MSSTIRPLAFDTETVPQTRYVTPATFEGYGGTVKLDQKWIESGHDERVAAAERDGYNLGAANFDVIDYAIRSGRAVLAATGVMPSLHPTTCHVVQVSFARPSTIKPGDVDIKIFQTDDYPTPRPEASPDAEGDVAPELAEGRLLLDALQFMHDALDRKDPWTLVSFNGKDFDVAILRGRALLSGIAGLPWLPWNLLRHPYNDDKHIDLRIRLGNGDRKARGTLQWWAEAFGVHAEEHGTDVYDWVKAGRWDLLRQYGHVEGKTLVRLFQLDAKL